MVLSCEDSDRRAAEVEEVPQAQLLNLQKNGQFTDELVKIEDAQIHCLVSQTYHSSNNSHEGDSVRGTIIIVCVVCSYFVSGNLI